MDYGTVLLGIGLMLFAFSRPLAEIAVWFMDIGKPRQ
jgi:hypothetical protein